MTTDLKRELGLVDTTMINVGTMIASAIFIVPATVAALVTGSAVMILVWVVGGVVSLLGALSVAELGAAYPEAGGQYAYLREPYGPMWGFLYGWANFAVINPASIAAIAVGFASYLGFFVTLSPGAIKIVAVLSILALTGLNCLGVRLGATTQNVLTFLKVGALAALIAAAFLLPGGSSANFQPLWPSGTPSTWLAPFRGATAWERDQRPGQEPAPVDHPLDSDRHRALRARQRGILLRAVTGADGALDARGLRRGAGYVGRAGRRARRGSDSRVDPGSEQRHHSHGGAHSLRHGARRPVLPIAGHRASALRDAGRGAAHARGDRVDPRAHGTLRSTRDLRRFCVVRVLRPLGGGRDAAAPHRSPRRPSIPHVGLSCHAAGVHRVRGMAGGEHDHRDPARVGRGGGSDSCRAAGLLVLEEKPSCGRSPPRRWRPIVDQLPERRGYAGAPNVARGNRDDLGTRPRLALACVGAFRGLS